MTHSVRNRLWEEAWEGSWIGWRRCSALLVIGLMMPLCFASASAASSCFGKKAKVVSSAKKIIGTKAPDTIVVKGGGSHYVNGLGGNDRICGGPGDETIIGDRGTDRINGGGGNDDINGGKGSDDLRGGGGGDKLGGDKGSDKMDGGSGDDIIRPDSGSEKVDGGGDDTAYGGVDGASCSNFKIRYNCGRTTTPDHGVQVVVSRGLDGAGLVIKGDTRTARPTSSIAATRTT